MSHGVPTTRRKPSPKTRVSVCACCVCGFQVLLKTLDTTTPSPEKVEFFTLTKEGDKVVHKTLNTEDSGKLLNEVQATTSTEGDM